MNHPSTPPTKHNVPALFIVAAVVLILFCGVGIAALMGWLPSSEQAGRPGKLMTPPAEQLATAAINAPTGVTQSSQYAAGAGTVNDQPVTSGASVGGTAGGSGVMAAPVLPVDEPRVQSPARKETLNKEREREASETRATERKEAAKPVCSNCGIVESVTEHRERGQGSGMGAAGGAVVGGLLGRQVGDGRGRDLATIAGAVGGAVVGNQVEGNMKATKRYEVTVRMHDGQIRTVQTDQTVWRAGDQVRVKGDKLFVR